MNYLNINELSISERKVYYQELRDYYKQMGIGKDENYKKTIHSIFHQIASYLRKYDLEIINSDKIDFSESKIFVSNHSNAHDFYTIQEVFKNMIHILEGSDCVNKFTEFIFKISGGVLIDRRDKESCYQGLYNLVKYLVNDESILILAEGTWNIHPSKLMLPMKHGASLVAQISQKPIVPVLFEYLENDGIINKEDNLYRKCIVQFLDEIYVSENDDLSKITCKIRDELATARWKIWEKQGIYNRKNLNNMEMKNHTEIKYDTANFKYDKDYELQFILGYNNPIYDYYPINGIDFDEEGKQILKKVKL